MILLWRARGGWRLRNNAFIPLYQTAQEKSIENTKTAGRIFSSQPVHRAAGKPLSYDRIQAGILPYSDAAELRSETCERIAAPVQDRYDCVHTKGR